MASSSRGRVPPPGMPILSGPPPIVESENCRKCDKSFNLLFRRSHPCGHCGYEYCSDCMSDGQALMPRKVGEKSMSSGGFLAELKDAVGIDDKPKYGNGYEVERVCLPCLSMLQVTSAPIDILRSLPLKRLKEYLAAYDIPCIGPKEKEDFVQAALKARNPATGCLSHENESYYRRKSVPNGNAPTIGPSPSAPRNGPRPAAANQRAVPQPTPAQPSYQQARPAAQPAYRPPPPQQQYRPPPPQQQARPPPQASFGAQPQVPRPAAARAPAPTPAPAAKVPPPPVPTIMSLVALPTSYLSSLSIGTLKAILYENHVKVDFKQVLEKQELINRVSELVIAERKRLERQRYEEEQMAGGSAPIPTATTNGTATPPGADGEQAPAAEGAAKPPAVPTGPMPDIDRGLCVVCQDGEATLAVVDCGHLCMCAHCSDLIMATSRECPLCRTRIVTEQRLIRIFKV